MRDTPNKSERVRQLLKSGMSPMEIAKQADCRVQLVYNIKSTLGLTSRRRPARAPAAKMVAKEKSTSSGGNVDLSAFLDAVRRTEKDKAAFRAALERIEQIVRDALMQNIPP